MSSDRPLVSIVVCSYNYAYYIGQTIASVLAQTYDNWELIVSDDGSTDTSMEVIRSFSDPRITVIASESNRGGAVAYAEAYKLCRGKYFTSLDSDDYIVPSKLEKQVQYFEDHPDIDILSTFVTEVDASGQIIGDQGVHQIWFNQKMDLNQPDSWLWQNHLCHSSALIRKAFHDQIGLTNPNLPYTADYEFWVRCLIGGGRFHVLPEKLTYYRAHRDMVTHKNPRRSLVEIAFIHTLLKPYLLKINRYDLVDKAIHLGHQRCGSSKGIDKNLGANILDQLLFAEDGADNFERFHEKLCSPPRAEALIIGKIFDSFYEKAQSLEAHAKNLQQVLADKEAHISETGAHIGNLETHIGDVEAEANKLRQVLADKEAHISETGAHIGNLETHIGDVEAEANKLRQVLADKEAHISETGAHIGNLETHIGDVEAEANKLRQVLADKEAHISETGAHIGNLETHIGDVEAEANKLRQVLADKEAHISETGAHIGNLETHIGDVEAEANKLRQVLADKEAHISQLGAYANNFAQVIARKESEIHSLEERLAAIESTIVWRIMRKWHSLSYLLAGSK